MSTTSNSEQVNDIDVTTPIELSATQISPTRLYLQVSKGQLNASETVTLEEDDAPGIVADKINEAYKIALHSIERNSEAPEFEVGDIVNLTCVGDCEHYKPNHVYQLGSDFQWRSQQCRTPLDNGTMRTLYEGGKVSVIFQGGWFVSSYIFSPWVKREN